MMGADGRVDLAWCDEAQYKPMATRSGKRVSCHTPITAAVKPVDGPLAVVPAAERKPGSFFFASSFPGRRVLSPSPGLSRLSCSLTLSTLCPALCLPRQLTDIELLLLINLLSFAPPPIKR